MPACKRCGGPIHFRKRAGRWVPMEKKGETEKRHQCPTPEELKSELSQIRYNNKKYGKNGWTRKWD